MDRFILLACSLLLTLYLLYGLLLYLKQESFIYYPTGPVEMPELEAIVIESGGESLKIWKLNPGRESAILYFGGNAEQVANLAIPYGEWFPQFTVYLVNYRGYGGSTGRPTQSGLYQDALNIYDRVAQDHRSISVIGRSLGSAVATHLAANRKVERVGLISPFYSIVSLARKLYPWYPVAWLLRDHYESWRNAAKLNEEVLVISSADDVIVPLDSTARLIDSMTKAKLEVVELSHGGHNHIDDNPDYSRALRSYFTAP